jgi:hypothetical protein
MLFNFFVTIILKFVSLIFSPLGTTALPVALTGAFGTLFDMMGDWGWLVPLDTLLSVAQLVIGFELAIFTIKVAQIGLLLVRRVRIIK